MQQRGADTKDRILDVAQAMIQEKGYAAVSFRDLAKEVSIKPASIYYYFPSKEDLVEKLVGRYRGHFDRGRLDLDKQHLSPSDKLEQYIEILRAAFRQTGRMCLCGVLAAEASALPKQVAKCVQAFFKENESWLEGVLRDGKSDGVMNFFGTPKQAAQSLFASLEGAMMSAWTFKDEARLIHACQWILQSLESAN